MNAMKKVLPLICCFLSLVSCERKGGNDGRKAIPYVSELLSGAVPGFELLKNSNETGSVGSIYVCGASSECAYLCDSLMNMDMYDNASGARYPDYLADFSGETIVSVEDSTLKSSLSYLEDGDTTDLRTLAVNLLLGALDTSCYLSRFDNMGLGRKKAAKQLILTDPAFALYGKYDLDTLLSASGCDVKVMIPAVCAFEELKSNYEKTPDVAVMTDVAPGSYQFYSDICSEYFGALAEVYCHASGSLFEFMDAYIEDVGKTPLNAIVVDCCAVNMKDLYKDYSRMTDVMCEDYVVYGQLFSKDFKFVSALRSVARVSYSDMRKRNLFTHNISLPASENYCFIPSRDDSSFIKIIECSR